MLSSPACWATFGAVLAREYSHPELADIHRLSVDAYAAQHPGTPSPQAIASVGLHLCRLVLLLDRGLPAAQANAAMLELGRHKRRFAWLQPPGSLGAVTVADVHAARSLDEHAAAARRWARSALDAWAPHRATVEQWVGWIGR